MSSLGNEAGLIQSLPAEISQITHVLSSPTASMYPAATTLASVTVSSAAAAFTAVNATSAGESRPGAENGECKLLGPFALFIQGALGLLALLSLVFKRWRERPQRPLKVWFFDVSKQVVGSALLHVANLLLSMLSSGQLTLKADEYEANPCSFYLLNLAIDTTIGIPILIVLLRLVTHGFSLTPFGQPPESIKSGHYGQPPRAKWWLKQCFIYFLGLLGMKFCVYLIFQICPWIVRVGDWALRWTEGNEMVQIFFVMLFFPVVMNAIQYYIVDSFIKDQNPTDHEPIPSEDGDADSIDDNGRRRRRSTGGLLHDGSDDSDVEDETDKKGAVAKVSEDKEGPPVSELLNIDSHKPDDYDPARDGEGSGGSRGEAGR